MSPACGPRLLRVAQDRWRKEVELGLAAEIDRLVYKLYGLTEEEIRIVEGATQG